MGSNFISAGYIVEQKLNRFRQQVAIEVKIDGEHMLAEVLEKSALSFSTDDLEGFYGNNPTEPFFNVSLDVNCYVERNLLQKFGGRKKRHELQERLKNELQYFFSKKL